MDDLKKEKIWSEILLLVQSESLDKREHEKDFRELMALFGAGKEKTQRQVTSLIERGLLTRRRGPNGAYYYSPNNP